MARGRLCYLGSSGRVNTHRLMNYLAQRNLDGFLSWQEKYRREYVEFDAWPPVLRRIQNEYLEEKRRAAREWMATCPWRRRKVRVQTLDALAPDTVRGIWTARKALKR